MIKIQTLPDAFDVSLIDMSTDTNPHCPPFVKAWLSLDNASSHSLHRLYSQHPYVERHVPALSLPETAELFDSICEAFTVIDGERAVSFSAELYAKLLAFGDALEAEIGEGDLMNNGGFHRVYTDFCCARSVADFHLREVADRAGLLPLFWKVNG